MSVARRLWRIARSELERRLDERPNRPATPGWEPASSGAPSSADAGATATPSRVVREDLEYYANLELEPGASFSEIRAAHKRLMRKYHPDLHMASPEKQGLAEQIVKRLNRAVEHFGNKHRRGELE